MYLSSAQCNKECFLFSQAMGFKYFHNKKIVIGVDYCFMKNIVKVDITRLNF